MIEYLQILGQEVYKIIFLLIPILVSVAMIVWLDRRVWGLVQKRKGPNVVGPFGILQSLADALKFIFKEKLYLTLLKTIKLIFYFCHQELFIFLKKLAFQ